jgi:hypothetical protein
MQGLGRTASWQKVPEVYGGFYRQKRTGGWRDWHGLVVAGAGAAAFGITIIAGGVLLIA